MLKNIELAFISDDNYVMPLIVAIISLKFHLNPAYQYHIHASSAAMQKFNLPLILKNLDKVLYLDSDIIIQNDLVAFFNLDITEYYCAAVPDGLLGREMVVLL